ncbi:MAG TPA: proline--tRNA ligase [Polyangiaceae bacterium]|nr:proline--tRNA ligase [Polyangiaceae bacterium]
MLFSRALVPTMKEAPADATNASHILLSRAGYIRRVGAGVYDFLPLGLRVLRRVESIVREEMDRAGALEILMPALLPAEYFKETGRWDLYGDVLFRLRDRKGADYHLGPTHEEIVTDIARREIRSWRDLPRNLYQVQVKFRDEPRPRGGLLRGREFLMKDAYSFDADEAGARASYERMRQAYVRIFDRMGLDYRMVQADSGAIGGSTSAEFQVLVGSGEDAVVACENCDYAANVEAAEPAPPPAPGVAPPGKPEKVATPTQRSIEEVSAFLRVPKEQTIKSLVYTTGDGPYAGKAVMCIVRGDHEVNEIALARVLGAREVFLASEAVVEQETRAAVGFAGPVGFDPKRTFVDHDAAAVRGAVAGANEVGFHLTGVYYLRDYSGETYGLRMVGEGDPCPRCGGRLRSYRGIEAGHIFILGTRYSAAMGAVYSDEKQQQRPLVMGCYGIGVSRLVATTVEQHHDDDGIRWPSSIAPYQVHVVTLGKDDAVLSAARALHDDLERGGIDVLWDDRDERPGVKFKDADLIGIPLRVTIGAKGLAAGRIEFKPRTEADAKKADLVPLGDAARVIIDRVRAAVRA